MTTALTKSLLYLKAAGNLHPGMRAYSQCPTQSKAQLFTFWERINSKRESLG
jgi:hypothetical protein